MLLFHYGIFQYDILKTYEDESEESKMNKNKTPKDVTALCEQIVRGYERRRKDYQNKRDDIIHSCGVNYSSIVGGKTTGNTSDPTQRKAERLQRLEDSLDFRLMRAVEQSLLSTGTDVSETVQRKLHNAILLNIENGREYTYEFLNIDEFSRSDFYRRKRRFLKSIGTELGLID